MATSILDSVSDTGEGSEQIPFDRLSRDSAALIIQARRDRVSEADGLLRAETVQRTLEHLLDPATRDPGFVFYEVGTDQSFPQFREGLTRVEIPEDHDELRLAKGLAHLPEAIDARELLESAFSVRQTFSHRSEVNIGSVHELSGP